MKKRNGLYILFILGAMGLLGAGYALFAETLNISGSATAVGSFDVEFTSAVIFAETDSTGATAVIDGPKNTVTLAAGNLIQPGASVTYRITVTNVNTLGAELLSVDVTGDTSDPDITITTPVFPVGTTLNETDTYVFDVTVEWDSGSSNGSKSITFDIDLNYQQA